MVKLKQSITVIILSVVLLLALTTSVQAQATVGVKDGKCDTTRPKATWLDAAGNVTTSAAVGSAYKWRVDFTDPDCAGKVKVDVIILKDGEPAVSCRDIAITATDPAAVCDYQVESAGTYGGRVSYKDINGAQVTYDVREPRLSTPAANTTPSTTPSPTFAAGVVATIQNPIPFNSLGELLVAAIRFILTMLGALAVFFIIVGAVKMVTSQGNEKNITSGKQTIQWAVIGLIVALMSFSVIALVQSFLQRQ